MDIKAMIDNMTEAEAKAALKWFVEQANVFICCEYCPFEDGCPNEATVKECERHFLDCVLKEARK